MKTAPKDEDIRELRLGHVRRILAAFDGSDDSRRALMHARRLAGQHHARLVVIQIVPPITCQADYGYGPVTRYLDNVEAEKEATRRLNEMLRREERAAKDYQYGASPNRQRFSAPQPEVLVKSGCAWEQILKAAEKLHADLIVVGGHEHGLPESTICVGTGTATASKARCPTLIVKREGVELKPASHEHGGHI